jgi:hypothetical protein
MFNSNASNTTPFRSTQKRKREQPSSLSKSTPVVATNDILQESLKESPRIKSSLRSTTKRGINDSTSTVKEVTTTFSSRKKVTSISSSIKSSSSNSSSNKLIDIFEANYEQQYGAIKDAKLYHEGGLLVLRERALLICLSSLKNTDIKSKTDKFMIDTSILSVDHPNLNLFELQNSNTTSQTRYLLAAYSSISSNNDNKRNTGLLLIVINEDTSNYTLTENKIDLIHDNEEISSISQYDRNHFLLGSTRNEMYLTKCNEDGYVTLHQLSSHNLLLDMVQTGVQWLGLSNPFASKDRIASILNMITLPKHHMVVSIGTAVTTAWYNVQNVGDEAIVWKVNLKSIIKDDINSISTAQKVVDDGRELIMDAVIGPAHEDDTTAVLYILSRIKESQATAQGRKEVCKLWLHAIEINISRDVNTSNTRICSRVCISEDINEVAIACKFLAKLYIVPSTGHLQILWLTPGNVFTVCIDSNRLPDIANPHHNNDQNACNSGVRNEDTGIESAKFQSSVLLKNEQRASVLDHVGVLTLTAATALILTRDFDIRTAEGGMASMARADAMKTLISYTKGQIDIKKSLACLNRFDIDKINDMVEEINTSIADEKPSGQHWDYQSSDKVNLDRATYQLSHYFVDEKVKSHKRLIELLEASRTPISDSILKTHQLLLGCKGISDYIQQAYTASKSSTRLEYMQDKHILDMNESTLNIHRIAIDIAMETRNIRSQEWKLLGLSSADIFYSSIKCWVSGPGDGLSAFYESLKRNKSIHAAFGVAYMMLSAVQCAEEGHGNSQAGVELLSSDIVRNSILNVMDVVKEFVKNDNNLDIVDVTKKLFSDVNDGKRLRELCRLLLKSYAIEAEELSGNKDASQMSDSFKASYQDAKRRCIDIFITLKEPLHAFKLSNEFYYFKGLLEATELDASLRNKLLDVVKTDFNTKGTEVDQLGTYCLKWFEQKEQIPAILEFGDLEDESTGSQQLKAFLSSRPQIAWIYQISKRSYNDAAKSLYHSAAHNNSCKKVLLSIAKISSRLSNNNQVFNDVNADLFVLKAQDLIGDRSDTNAITLVNKLLDRVRNDGNLLMPLTSVEVSDDQKSHRTELCNKLLMTLQLIFKMKLSPQDKLDVTLLVWATSLSVDKEFWVALGTDSFHSVNAAISRQMKETLFSRLVSSVVVDVKAGKLDNNEVLLSVDHGLLRVEDAITKANLQDEAVYERLIDIINICYKEVIQ